MDDSNEPKSYFKNALGKRTQTHSNHSSVVDKISEMIEQGTISINETSHEFKYAPIATFEPQPVSPKPTPVVNISPEQRTAFVHAVSKERKLIQLRRQKKIQSQD